MYDDDMRVVIDTNQLQSNQLRIFLGADSRNMAVLPEHTILEIFKPSTLEGVYSAFEVMADFPDQIIQLRANRHVADTNVRFPGFANRFIAKEATRGMPRFIELLNTAREGSIDLQRQLEERRGWALERIDKTISAFGDIAEELAAIRSQFNPADLAAFSRDERTSHEFKYLLFDLTTRVADDLSRQRTGRSIPNGQARYNDFTWRYALCHLLQLVRLVGNGSVRRKPNKVANDHLDNVFATFGTYYNGLMTNDASANATHAVARVILEILGARVPEDYLGGGYMLKIVDDLYTVEPTGETIAE